MVARRLAQRRSRAPRAAVLAFDLGGSKLAAALVERSGRIAAQRREAVAAAGGPAIVEQMARLAGELVQQHGSKPAAAGVAVPGLVRRNGTVWAPNLAGWEKMPLARLLSRRLRMPVAVESDRAAAVLGEAWRGAARGASDVVALIVGTGIGAGILSGGRIVRGAHELSGCAGWMVVTPEEHPEMRRVGCLEWLAAGPAISRGQGMSTEELAARARAGDAAAQEAFRRAGRWLGAAAANLISLFDPQVVVLGGGVTGAADLYLDELRRVALARCQPLAARAVRIQISTLGERGNLLGAAALAWETTASAARAARRRRPT